MDLEGARRATRVMLIQSEGFEVVAREALGPDEDESTFDLVVVGLHTKSDFQIEYCDHLARKHPNLPILLLRDHDSPMPQGTLLLCLEAGDPKLLLDAIATALRTSTHVRDA